MAKRSNKEQEEPVTPAGDITVLLKIGDHFILQNQVHSVIRFGRGSRIMLNSGDEILAKMNYDKVVGLVNK